MKRKVLWFWIVVVVIIAGIAVGVYVKNLKFDTTLKFTLLDSVSKEWVWDSKVTIQNREIKGYFQKEYLFTHLKPGKAELSIEVPHYVSKKIAVDLKKGDNSIDEPILLMGYEIPNLDHFVVFTDKTEDGIKLEIRPVGKDKKAILNHPCLNIKLVVRVSEQIKNGVFVTAPTDTGSERGKELFRDEVKWSWDPTPETIFRYSATIPTGKIRQSEAEYWVLDYLFIVPDPRKMGDKELDDVVKKVLSIHSPDKLTEYLDSYKGKFKYYIDTTWNEKASGK